GQGKVCAVRAETGRSLWETAGSHPRAAGDRVFAIDHKGTAIVAVEMETGERLWETTFATALGATGGRSSSDGDAFTGPLQAGAGIVLVGSGDRRNVQTTALSTKNGRPLWRSAMGDRYFGRGGGPFIIEGLVWNLDAVKGALIARDPQTGQAKKEIAAPAIRYAGHHARCYLARATCRYIIGKERGADFIDLKSGAVSWNNWLRGPCHRGVLPANGLLYAGQHSCRCYTEAALHGFHALAPKEQKTEIRGQKLEILEKGPAYGQSRTSDLRPPSSDSWPTFRHDGMRSGATPAKFPARPVVRWTKKLEGKLTSPVVASGRVCVAAIDRHTLYSLDAQTGEILWRYTAGGRIDTPPTIHQGLALFGCRDGWVYCLRATDGSPLWRLRAAPEDRFVGAYGQLESAWPVPGSILVKDNVAYCVAGRSSYLDGGLRILALNPRTGEMLHKKRLDGPWPEPETGTSAQTPNRGFTSEGALPDVLVADADFIYLRHLRLDASLQKAEDMKPNVYASPELTGENRGGDHKYWDNLIEAPRHALFTDPQWFHRSYFQNFPGRRLYATTGLIDDDGWHRRMYWSYGQVVGQYLVFRGPTGYAVQVFATSPREGGFNAGDGYVVYAGQSAEHENQEKLFALRPEQAQWRLRVPFRPTAMVLAGNKLILAGPPDSANPGQALAAIEGRQGGMLWVIDAADGERSIEYRLESSPRYDGMAVTEGKCYITTTDGHLMCLGDTVR
ncbi:MAG: outer membrane protein assembly factor BamB family protein, partial [Planctomycetota bacterium]